MVEAPPEPVETLRQVPILYNADTGQRLGGRYRRWANQFRLPTGAAVNVRLAPNEGYPGYYARGASTQDDVLYLDPKAIKQRGGAWGRKLLFHELAHRYDYRRADESTRQRFSQIMGAPYNEEQFAEALAQYTVWPKYTGGSFDYGYRPTRRQWRQTRRLFDGLK